MEGAPPVNPAQGLGLAGKTMKRSYMHTIPESTGLMTDLMIPLRNERV